MKQGGQRTETGYAKTQSVPKRTQRDPPMEFPLLKVPPDSLLTAPKCPYTLVATLQSHTQRNLMKTLLMKTHMWVSIRSHER
jgi:hypothetical protein